ncbi:MAG: CoA activase [Planctomycetes bacterium]|nr:CoA activase [Planctomycetota bacterium]
MPDRFLGIDVGAETVKVAELVRDEGGLVWAARRLEEHHKDPGAAVAGILAASDPRTVAGAAVTGRFSRALTLPRVPAKEALAAGFRFLHDPDPATVVSIGGHGFSVLELRAPGVEIFRENSRCSQGTGNFLRQLVERFGLSIEEASALCAEVTDPAPLSGRCPVILKTDMTHLANKGESRARILAGLYDAVCENVQVLIKPRVSPSRVLLAGGVVRSDRIRAAFRRFLERHEMQLMPHSEDVLFLEALGAAVAATESRRGLPEVLLAPPEKAAFESIPALGTYLGQVKRMDGRPLAPVTGPGLVLGFDIGSTGSKAVALDALSRETVWEGYRNTSGDPVGAAQALMRQYLDGPAGRAPVLALGATGSGREIAGSLMATCYGPAPVFVLNEIAAHAAGALHWDPRVDTIFEIGGQDAKYIRLAGGRVVDAAMNEACSAGTGSFIEEQGKRFAGVENVVQLAEKAVSSPCGVSLGQHCSVFMAEVIDNAAASGVEASAIIPGIYDSVVQNYLNRVKGSRTVGQVVFCQGMPFSAPALAAAVARQTGCEVVIPPNPGTVGALGIALLALEEKSAASLPPLDPTRFLEARVEGKDTFICGSTKGCGGTGNKCRIDRLSTVVAGKKSRFTWGGACSLYDRGTGRRKLPDLAPDPFRRREEMVTGLVARLAAPGAPRIGMTDEFVLKELFPFFATFFHALGLEPVVSTGADHAALKRGIEESNIPFCAPMQLYHGIVSKLAEEQLDWLFLPMVRDVPRTAGEPHAVTCPIEQGSADLLKWDLGPEIRRAIVSPVIDIGEDNLRSGEFRRMCAALAKTLGRGARARGAFEAALEEQERFDRACHAIGREALDFCRRENVTPVVVLGRVYTIYNTVLNSNVPAILRDQGALPIPVDCYPVAPGVPVFRTVFWGHTQRTLRAAHQIRRTPGVYSLFCSNYSCGPDSFATHFYSYIMNGKPFAVIETDGHSGDAGTKTRAEAFLYCVKQDLAGPPAAAPASLDAVERDTLPMRAIRARGDTMLIPRLSQASEAMAACLRGVGYRAESLGVPGRDDLRAGRRHTSGKECIPMTLLLGAFLERVRKAPPHERFTVLMPTANGPCRFGVYHLLQKIVVERLDLKERIRLWSPSDTDYFDEAGKGFGALAFAGIMAGDVIEQAFREARLASPDRAREIRDRFFAELLALLESAGRGGLTVARALRETATGRAFGLAALVRRAAAEFAALPADADRPSVLVVGEIYVRCDPFSSDDLIRRLEDRGLRVRFAPVSEWFEYSADLNLLHATGLGLGERLAHWIQSRLQDTLYAAMASPLRWPPRTTAQECLDAARPWIRGELEGEAALTLGEAVAEWRHGLIDGAVSAGPHECMPNKVAEAQFFHVAESEGLPSLTLSLNGDPVDPEILDRFAYEVHSRFRSKRSTPAVAVPSPAAAVKPRV